MIEGKILARGKEVQVCPALKYEYKDDQELQVQKSDP